MSKMKLALDVVENLRSLADSLETLANAAAGIVPDQPAPTQAVQTTQPAGAAQPAATTQPVPTTQPAAAARPAPAEPRLTLVELRAFVAERSSPENRPKIKAILESFGVKKLTELPDQHYAALKARVEAL